MNRATVLLTVLFVIATFFGCTKKSPDTDTIRSTDAHPSKEKSEEKEPDVVLAKRFSSPLKNVTWKPQPGVFKFGSRVREIKENGKAISYIRHLGEDFIIEAGTPVLACADGYVSFSDDVPGTPQRPQWGGIVVITHWLNDNVGIYSIYGHIERDKSLRPRGVVRRGQQLGKVAKSKTAENGWWDVPPHLHFQILIDPLGRYEEGKVPPGHDHIRKDGRIVPFPAPYRLIDHIAPSEVVNAKNPVGLLLKEKANKERRDPKKLYLKKEEDKPATVLAKKFSSPFKGVKWTVEGKDSSCKFGEPIVHDIPGKGRVPYGKHLGEDYWIDAGTPVLACADGYISLNNEYPGKPEKPSWGGIVIISHWLVKNRVAVYTIYGHLDERTSLKPGEFVRRGEQIGRVSRRKSPQMGHWDDPPQLHLQFMLDPLSKYRHGMIPAGYDSFYQDGKLTPFDAPYRLLDHIAPSETLNAEDPVALLIKEEANPKRR